MYMEKQKHVEDMYMNMNNNFAPEKIYLQVCGDCTLNDKETCEQCCKDNPINNGREVTWCVDKIFDNDVEYTRTDAFIEKACEFLANGAHIPLWEGYNGTFGCDPAKLVQNFRNYMKGE